MQPFYFNIGAMKCKGKFYMGLMGAIWDINFKATSAFRITINVSSLRYTPTELKDIAGQADKYIRPLQKNIPEENHNVNTEQVEVSDPRLCYLVVALMCIINTSVHLHQYSSHILQHDPMIECFQCHEMVSMHEFRQHQEDKYGKTRKLNRLCRLCSM